MPISIVTFLQHLKNDPTQQASSTKHAVHPHLWQGTFCLDSCALHVPIPLRYSTCIPSLSVSIIVTKTPQASWQLRKKLP